MPAQVSSAFSKASATRDALLKQCQTLAEALRVEKIPKLEDFMDEDAANNKDKNKEANKIELDRGLKQRKNDENDALLGGANVSEWESDEQRRFYRDMLPIKESIPAVLLVEKPALGEGNRHEREQREKQEAQDFKVDALINRLRRDCENAEKVDAFAVDFATSPRPELRTSYGGVVVSSRINLITGTTTTIIIIIIIIIIITTTTRWRIIRTNKRRRQIKPS